MPMMRMERIGGRMDGVLVGWSVRVLRLVEVLLVLEK